MAAAAGRPPARPPGPILVTGATDGIGLHTASLLAQRGATVLLHGRKPERLQRAADRIERATGRQVRTYCADLARLRDVRALAGAVLSDHPSLSVLINNAGAAQGVFAPARQVTEDGHELTWAVNVLAPFLLTRLLHAHVTASVITTASVSAASRVDFSDLQQQRGAYNAHAAYSLSKLCNIAFTLRLARVLRRAGSTTTANTLDPGTVNTKMLLAGWGRIGAPTLSGMDVGHADHTFRLATDPQALEGSGQYYVGMRPCQAPAPARDLDVQHRLWALWEAQVGEEWA